MYKSRYSMANIFKSNLNQIKFSLDFSDIYEHWKLHPAFLMRSVGGVWLCVGVEWDEESEMEKNNKIFFNSIQCDRERYGFSQWIKRVTGVSFLFLHSISLEWWSITVLLYRRAVSNIHITKHPRTHDRHFCWGAKHSLLDSIWSHQWIEKWRMQFLQ